MQALKDTTEHLRHIASAIEWDEANSMWVLKADDGSTAGLVEDNDYEVVTFNEAILPSDFFPDKYWYRNGIFIVDPDYGRPAVPFKYMLEQLQQQINTVDGKAYEAQTGVAEAKTLIGDTNINIEEALLEQDMILAELLLSL